MKLILIAAVAAVALVVAPFIILWNAGKYGPAFAFVLAGIVIGIAGYNVFPPLPQWPVTKSQLTIANGKVTNAYSVSRGGSNWYEVELSTTNSRRHTLPSQLGKDDVAKTLGTNLEIGCVEVPGYSCRTVSLVSDGKTLINYDDKRREHDREALEQDQYRQWSYMAAIASLLMAAGAAVIGAKSSG